MDFLLFCGAGNSLSSAEVLARSTQASEKYPNIFRVSFEIEEEATALASLLGSSIKLAKLLENVSANTDSIATQVKSKNFSITSLTDKVSPITGQDLKDVLGKGRFIESQDNYGISPIHLTKHKVDEFFIDTQEDAVWQTVWVHNYKHWIQKDRFMPFVNAKAGMLPPKIARSMINMAPSETWGVGKTLVDPFCGSGRVVVEALELGFNAFGADILQSQCQETRQNIKHLGFTPQVECLDATHLSSKFKNNIDLIVTEPFMGKPNLRPDKIKYLVPGLQKLYLGCLKDWLTALKPNGVVVMVFPILSDGKKDYKTSKIIDDKLNLSYNQLNKGLIYSRPGATVKREILVLQKK